MNRMNRMNRLAFGAVLVGVVVINISTIGCARQDETNFESCRALVLAGKYEQAITALEAYVETHPDSKQASRAGLFLFKANFAKGDLDSARKWCEWTIQKFPDSLEARKCEFKLGLVFLAQEKFQEAKQQFEFVAGSAKNPLKAEAEFFIEFVQRMLTIGELDPETKSRSANQE